MSELYYVYPQYKNMSFTLIAEKHIEYLSKYVKVQKIMEEALDSLSWLQKRKILLHPILYVTIGDRLELFPIRYRRLRSLLKVKDKIGGFETCDSDRISELAVNILNKFDLVFVPSNFAKEVFLNCGVESKVEVLPHGVSNSFFEDSKPITNKSLLKLKEIKEKNNAILVLYFLLHSGFRKGADLAYKAMEIVQYSFPYVFLVVKRASFADSYMEQLKKLKMIEIVGWFNEEELKQLYDLCDILIVPSRGGGFELNALEGMARGLPTIVPNNGCFKDYSEYAITYPANKRVEVLPNNPIHVGMGFECEPIDLATSIIKVVGDLEKYKKEAKLHVKEIKEKYSWDKIGEKLYNVLIENDFINKA
jgi:glycosyltransferase involved in cell wall biosynthesis